ncbi:hypothetical protein PCL_06562 [Purpureocillium lilacinum]|uniref:Uncharacterized protein n=1 Tax=Purpureocillium lilacinum TaxID=33203 RepID=A0A2U3EN28_PURLI|nr:hypothetical protein PCL_06562 [Purpureocillium lilacinum]
MPNLRYDTAAQSAVPCPGTVRPPRLEGTTHTPIHPPGRLPPTAVVGRSPSGDNLEDSGEPPHQARCFPRTAPVNGRPQGAPKRNVGSTRPQARLARNTLVASAVHKKRLSAAAAGWPNAMPLALVMPHRPGAGSASAVVVGDGHSQPRAAPD